MSELEILSPQMHKFKNSKKLSWALPVKENAGEKSWRLNSSELRESAEKEW